MSKTLGVKIGFAVTVFALLVSIVAFFTMDKSFAWFARNDNVQAQGISVSVRDEGIRCTLLSFGVLDITDGVYTFENAVYDNGENVGERIQKFDLPMDDPNGISYSQYRKALVLELSITVEADRPTLVRLVTPNTDVSLAQDNFFSNCITVTDASLYTENTVAKGSEAQSFVSVSGENAAKESSLVLFEGTVPAGGEPTKLYFIIEYNDAFLDHINHFILNENPGYFDVKYYHDVTLLIS